MAAHRVPYKKKEKLFLSNVEIKPDADSEGSIILVTLEGTPGEMKEAHKTLMKEREGLKFDLDEEHKKLSIKYKYKTPQDGRVAYVACNVAHSVFTATGCNLGLEVIMVGPEESPNNGGYIPKLKVQVSEEDERSKNHDVSWVAGQIGRMVIGKELGFESTFRDGCMVNGAPMKTMATATSVMTDMFERANESLGILIPPISYGPDYRRR